MKHSHKLFSFLTLVSLIQFSFAMGQKSQTKHTSKLIETSDANGSIRIQEDGTLEFLDEKGLIKNQISLQSGKFKKTEGKNQYIDRRGNVSKNGRRAVVIETRGPEFIDSVTNEGETNDTPKDTSHLKILNYQGNTIWEKQLPQDRVAGSTEFSDDGKILATIQTWSNYHAHDKNPVEQLVVYDQLGAEIFAFPQKKGKWRLYGELKSSPSGQFVALRAKENQKPTLIILDIKNKKSWELETRNFIYEVRDDATAVFFTGDMPENEVNFGSKLQPINE